MTCQVQTRLQKTQHILTWHGPRSTGAGCVDDCWMLLGYALLPYAVGRFLCKNQQKIRLASSETQLAPHGRMITNVPKKKYGSSDLMLQAAKERPF